MSSHSIIWASATINAQMKFAVYIRFLDSEGLIFSLLSKLSRMQWWIAFPFSCRKELLLLHARFNKLSPNRQQKKFYAEQMSTWKHPPCIMCLDSPHGSCWNFSLALEIGEHILWKNSEKSGFILELKLSHQKISSTTCDICMLSYFPWTFTLQSNFSNATDFFSFWTPQWYFDDEFRNHYTYRVSLSIQWTPW